MKISLVLLLLTLLSACNQNNESNTSAENKLEPKPVVEQATEEGFDFSYKDLDDKEVKLSDYRGKWVIANFWATWCPPCRKEIPDFVKFKAMYGDQVEILGIDNEDAEVETIRDFAFEYKINYPILRANVYNPSEFSKANTMGLPTTVIFNPQGIQVAKRVGPMHFKDLVDIIKPNS